MMVKTGACACEAVTYRITNNPVHIYACHCLNCQARSGSAFGEHAMVQASDFTLDGAVATRARTHQEVEFEEVFCDACLSRIYNRNSFLPHIIFLRAGTLSERQNLQPIAHIWTRRKQRWVVLPENVPSFEESPTPEEFGAVIQAAKRAGST